MLKTYEIGVENNPVASEEGITYDNSKAFQKQIGNLQKEMEKAASDQDFMQVAHYRDALKVLKARIGL